MMHAQSTVDQAGNVTDPSLTEPAKKLAQPGIGRLLGSDESTMAEKEGELASILSDINPCFRLHQGIVAMVMPPLTRTVTVDCMTSVAVTDSVGS